MIKAYIPGADISSWVWNDTFTLTSLLLILAISTCTTYLTTSFIFHWRLKAKQYGSSPPTLPYWVPGIGHAISLWWGLEGIFNFANTHYPNHPLRIKVLSSSAYIISGSSSIRELWRNSRFTTTHSYREFSSSLFALPPSAKSICLQDDSGIRIHPLPGSNILPENRINYHSVQFISMLCLGPSMHALEERFRKNLYQHFQSLQTSRTEMKIGIKIRMKEWQHMPDLYTFLFEALFHSIITALCGSSFFALNPNFCNVFMRMDKGRSAMGKSYPRWMRPDIYRSRDRCLESVRRWQDYILANGPEDNCRPEDWDDVYGSGIFRYRHKVWAEMEGFKEDQDARVSEDFALIYTSTGTIIAASFWAIAEIFADPSLLSSIRTEIATCSTNIPSLDIETLIQKPLIQSVYAETLRLKASTLLLRYPTKWESGLNLNGWVYPKDSRIFVSNYHAHRDEQIWNSGSTDDPHPVNTFWAERFLVYPSMPFSGPRKPQPDISSSLTRKHKHIYHEHCSNKGEPRFSPDHVKDAYFPYGGGSRPCTGQKLAKREIISCLATVCTMLDIELDNPTVPDVNMACFGFAILTPKQATPFRFRFREA